jgi:hypothetical protein
MKNIFTLLSLALSLTAFSQSPSIGIPDSVKNLPFTGSTGQYTISNPLVYEHLPSLIHQQHLLVL